MLFIQLIHSLWLNYVFYNIATVGTKILMYLIILLLTSNTKSNVVDQSVSLLHTVHYSYIMLLTILLIFTFCYPIISFHTFITTYYHV